ncbi:MAG: NOB1 family endonuclease [Desulfarculales bacterium]|jgi:predicted RNA-binding Zn-ribbon protein involved in translation (DUF1610 family)|nr:NOB1 family endonuclease [Desulfarculales bacterium]
MAYREKICLEQDCQDAWEEMVKHVDHNEISRFSYCPFCANQITTRCSACNEYVNDAVYRFCPWCGERFE